ncbi:MAG: apolipoprotein N-acyltransferase [Armatimonadetes bacterium]|nr:apolipoprotein N-acyltransferase [Armatimonadota bacterium]
MSINKSPLTNATLKRTLPVKMSLAVASGMILAISMPKPGWWPAAWIGLVPLLIALRSTRAKDAAICGLAAGLVYYGAICFWLTIFGYLPWFLVALKEALWFMLFAIAAAKTLQHNTGWPEYLTVSSLWTLFQWTRVLGPLGFTWGSLAHTQANTLPVIQLASITGPWGIDFLVCMVNVAFARLITDLFGKDSSKAQAIPTSSRTQGGGTRYVFALASLIITAAVWVGGHMALRCFVASDGVKVAIIQGSLPHEVNPGMEYVADAFAAYAQMSRLAAKLKPDFVIWPETTIVDEITDLQWEPQLSKLARETRANYVIGGYDASDDPDGRNYNAAHLYDRSGRKIGVYRKVHLVPYGEYVPFREQMPWLERYNIRDVDVLPGKRHNLIKTEIGKIGISICFESLFPAVSAQETRNGARALVIITNDAWFKRTQAARHHLMMARLRAVENRRYVARAAATGISAIIDPCGRVLKELPIYSQGILIGCIAPREGLTPYARLGDWFIVACVVVLVAAHLRRRS